MKNVMFRTLRADEIEVRLSHVKEGMANMLLYIDSRAVVALLNETIGNMNWQSEFYEVNGQTIGRIGIYDDDKKMWVWKSDTGSESKIEAEKGLISDIYKRVMSRWGVCELYSAPRISIPDDGYGNSGYKVSKILYNEHREIIHLVIVNRFGKEVFCWDITQPSSSTSQSPTTSMSCHDSILHSLRDSANAEYYKDGTNQEELRKFVAFYTNKIEKDGWNGNYFDFAKLFSSWMSRCKTKAS